MLKFDYRFLEDERIAILLQNEEFMNELRQGDPELAEAVRSSKKKIGLMNFFIKSMKNFFRFEKTRKIQISSEIKKERKKVATISNHTHRACKRFRLSFVASISKRIQSRISTAAFGPCKRCRFSIFTSLSN